jgi:hypothetical protein
MSSVTSVRAVPAALSGPFATLLPTALEVAR